ncbi:hypothetical protein D1AOALGA4SA_3582 [Olavius algarvensis Delta 1 endosymbiont]|nr:hypothetical protein D1AOALGA4SA_3582 [Olavius algarvensis Delta 1 endosymbiont]
MKFDSNDLKTILEDNVKKKLVLPNFQRSFIWDENNQKKLLSSFFLGLPVGNILILEGRNSDFAARELCTHESIIPREDCSYLLDGQQRISTLKSIFSNLYPEDPTKWRDPWDTIEPAHKLKIDQNKLQNCRSNILNLVNVL